MNQMDIGWDTIGYLKWVGVDFDGVIANNTGHPDYTPTTPIEGAPEALKWLEKEGYKPVIYTARPWSEYANIEAFCAKYDIPYRRIICGKPLFHKVIDDRNIEFTGSWAEALKKI